MGQRSSKSDLAIRVEKYPLPASVEAIISLVREIIERGSVQRIELDINLPVRVLRNVDPSDPTMKEVSVGLKGALRQANFVEYYSEDASPFQIVVDMMQLLNSERCHPTCWATGPSGDEFVDLWMEWKERGMPSSSHYLLGLPVKIVDDLSEDTLILCGSAYPGAEADEITMAIKTTIELMREEDGREPTDSETHDPVWPSAGERHPTACELALASCQLREFKRGPTGQNGEGVG